jgi:hypothetical protein
MEKRFFFRSCLVLLDWFLVCAPVHMSIKISSFGDFISFQSNLIWGLIGYRFGKIGWTQLLLGLCLVKNWRCKNSLLARFWSAWFLCSFSFISDQYQRLLVRFLFLNCLIHASVNHFCDLKGKRAFIFRAYTLRPANWLTKFQRIHGHYHHIIWWLCFNGSNGTRLLNF